MRLTQLIIAFFLVLYICDVESRGSRSSGRGSSRKHQSLSSKRKMSSGLSLSKKHMLLGAGGLASMYIGFKLASHRDLARYTICEGKRYEVDSMGIQKEYHYTVCPIHLQYCCRSELYEGERCCDGRSYSYTYSQSRGQIIGSLFGSLLMFIGIGLLVYFCCIRRRHKSTDVPTLNDDGDVRPSSPYIHSSPGGNVVTVGDFAPGLDPQVSSYPFPTPSNNDFYPNHPPPPYYTPTSMPGTLQPPPYPEVAVSNADNCPPYPPVSFSASRPSAPPPAPLGSGWGASTPTSRS